MRPPATLHKVTSPASGVGGSGGGDGDGDGGLHGGAEGGGPWRRVRGGSSSALSLTLMVLALVHVAAFLTTCVWFGMRLDELEAKVTDLQKVEDSRSGFRLTVGDHSPRSRGENSLGPDRFPGPWLQRGPATAAGGDKAEDRHHRNTRSDDSATEEQHHLVKQEVRKEVGEILKQMADATFSLEEEAVRQDVRMRIDRWVRSVAVEAEDRQKRQNTAGQELGNIFTDLAHREEEIFAKYCTNSSILCLPGPKGEIGQKGDTGVAGPTGATGAAGSKGDTGQKGDVGVQGPQGQKGDMGPQGPEGPKGADGLKGERGVDGPQGPKGDLGPQGVQGLKGDLGPQGVKGADGAVGPQGATGAKGDIGPKGDVGPQGNVGPKGDVGPQGDVGPKGDVGPQGAVGPKGEVGPQGDVGPKGDVGPQGNVGPKGDVGPQGDVGPKGDVGPQGDIGPKGEVGPQGDVGPKGDVGPQGIVGPKGEVGPQGDVGPKGEIGAQGATGNKGDRGDTGADGAKGEVGIQGPMGPAGPPGPKGTDGVPGLPGVKGGQGDKGEVGSVGPPGQQGPVGLKGDQGVRGDVGSQGPRGDQGVPGLSGPPGPKGDMGYSGPPGRVGQKGEPGDLGAAMVDSCCTQLSKPKFPETATLTVVEEGDNLTLVCGENSYPPSAITWLSNGIVAQDPRYYVDQYHHLIVTGVQRADEGPITCTAANALGTADRTFTIRVPQHLIIAGTPQNVTIVEGGKLTLECRFDNVPPPTIAWFHVQADGTRVPVTSGVTQTADGASTLTKDPAQVPDRGTYVCVGSNGVETVELIDHVIVESKPYITFTSGVVVGTAGDDLILRCQSDSLPYPSVSWNHDRNDSHVFEDANGDLHILDLRPADAGNYTCTAVNAHGHSTNTLQIVVKVPPHVSMAPDMTSLKQNLLFDCLATGDAPLTVTWLKDGQPLDLSSGRYIQLPSGGFAHRLLVTMTTDADVGLYSCAASNQHGLANEDTLVYKDIGAVSCTNAFNDCTATVCGAHCPVNCISDTSALVFGNNSYSEHSSICRSAIHAGVLNPGEAATVLWNNAANNAPFAGGVLRYGVQSTGAANEPLKATPIAVDLGNP